MSRLTLRTPRGPALWASIGLLLCAACVFLLRASILDFSPPTSADPVVAAALARAAVLKAPDWPVRGCPNRDVELLLPREKACILILARNEDEQGLKSSLQSFEAMFNADFKYPYVLLSDTPFKPAFLASLRSVLRPDAVLETGLVTPAQGWGMPDWMDKAAARAAMAAQQAGGVQYGGMESYHSMCRFYSGPFAMHPALAKYNWYWRLEPDVEFYCSIRYDPFRFLAKNDKVYGFNIAVIERPETIPTLYPAIADYRDQLLADGQVGQSDFWRFFQADGRGNHGWEGQERLENGEPGYNLCHFWTNFEIGDLRFFRGDEYQGLFNHLDRTSKFFTERWGDAPIRSLAVSMFRNFTNTHFFEDIAYLHDSWAHHPAPESGVGCDCARPPGAAAIGDDGWYSCLQRWKEMRNELTTD